MILQSKLSAKGKALSNIAKGWREIGFRRYYFRSRWEMNYARYLQRLMEESKIDNWTYQPYTFWFEGIKRGVRSYTPDFEVLRKDGIQEYHEVKGYLDARSKTILNRMRIYYPKVILVIVGKEWFLDHEDEMRQKIKDWE